MKTNIRFFVLLVVAGFAFSSCAKKDDSGGKGPDENKDFILGEKQTIEFQSSEDISDALLTTPLYANALSESPASSDEIINESTNIAQRLWEHLGKQEMPEGIKISSYAVKYRSYKPDGGEVWLSGRIYLNILYPIFKPDGVLIVPHYTIGSNAECPSQKLIQAEMMFAAENYLVFMPDYMGFGSTNGNAHPYLHYQWTVQAVYDMIKFGLKDMKVGKNEIYFAGYSQGGYSAYATQKFLEEKHPDEFKIKHTYVGGGPYDITGTYNDAVDNKKMGMPCAIPMLVLGLDAGENAKWPMSYFFKDPLLSKYSDYILSKNYTTTQINEMLTKDGIHKLEDMLTPEAMNKNLEQTKKFAAVVKKNSVSEWIPKAPVSFFHSSVDEVVPRLNTDNAYKYISTHATDMSPYTVEIKDYGNHGDAGVKFYTYVFTALWNW